MSTPIKSSLVTRLRRPRLWFAGVDVAIAGIAVVAGWMMLDTNPGNALMRPPAMVDDRRRLPAERIAVGGLRLAKVEPIAFREERATDGRIAINEDTTTPVFRPIPAASAA